ncbi:MAG: [NiFe]-hydrogenase assembly chaperone HybE [Methylobacillus sp.]|jgi:[NiFe] hydrogenase assembly HybE family chaperone|nr:[NiFe]-hydrogenase assembly chaperone HybE [Methylobacillus sp.]
MNQAIATLEAVFDEIARSRMAGLPIVNPALRVEAVGFREWQERYAGVLVTPWSISLVLLPGQDATLEQLAPDKRATWEFPSGSYEFMGLVEPLLGTCQICPLISPVTEFADHASASELAQEIARAVFAADGSEAKAAPQMSRRAFLSFPARYASSQGEGQGGVG